MFVANSNLPCCLQWGSSSLQGSAKMYETQEVLDMQTLQMGQMATDSVPRSADGKGPEKKFRAGAIAATVWKNDSQRATGETFSYHTVSLERRYKDKSGSWKSANSMRLQDLPRAALVLQEAYKYLVLNGVSADEVVVE